MYPTGAVNNWRGRGTRPGARLRARRRAESGSGKHGRALAHDLDQTLARVLDVVENRIETFWAAVVRIRNRRRIVFASEAHEQMQFVLVCTRALLLKQSKVLPIH